MLSSVLAFARAEAEKRKAKGLVAAISPTPEAFVDQILDELDINIPTGGIIVDMGMGDGRWLLSAVSRFGKSRGLSAVGVELDKERIARARTLMAERGLQFEVIEASFTIVDVSSASVVIVYLSREGNRLLSEKLEDELRPNAVVVAVGFAFCSTSWAKRLRKKWNCPYSSLPAYLYEM